MSTYSDLPSSRPIQRGSGLFSNIGKVFKKVPILSTGASFLPGGKLLAPVLSKAGLGRRRRRRVRRKPIQGGRINIKSLGRAALPLLKKSGLVSRLAGKSKVAPSLLKSLAQSQGFGRRRRRRRRKVHRRR